MHSLKLRVKRTIWQSDLLHGCRRDILLVQAERLLFGLLQFMLDRSTPSPIPWSTLLIVDRNNQRV